MTDGWIMDAAEEAGWGCPAEGCLLSLGHDDPEVTASPVMHLTQGDIDYASLFRGNCLHRLMDIPVADCYLCNVRRALRLYREESDHG